MNPKRNLLDSSPNYFKKSYFLKVTTNILKKSSIP